MLWNFVLLGRTPSRHQSTETFDIGCNGQEKIGWFVQMERFEQPHQRQRNSADAPLTIHHLSLLERYVLCSEVTGQSQIWDNHKLALIAAGRRAC